MIQVSHLTKVYAGKPAVDDISFTIEPGHVTGFLGPNGAGKSTTMRMIMGLETPTSGSATIAGKPFAQHRNPLQTAGALLDAKAIHPKRTARSNLLALAASNNLPASRVDEVLAITGLSAVARKRPGGYSLGMGQRLGIAATLLGDPQVLLFDEPVNGLDPEGVAWVRRLCRELAQQGRTVFISSHLMSEMAQTADHIVVIGMGKILANQSLESFLAEGETKRVRVLADDPAQLGQALAAVGATVTAADHRRLDVVGVDGREVGRAALELGIVLEELVPLNTSLEDKYLALTNAAVEYRTGGAPHDQQQFAQEGATR